MVHSSKQGTDYLFFQRLEKRNVKVPRQIGNAALQNWSPRKLRSVAAVVVLCWTGNLAGKSMDCRRSNSQTDK